MFENRVLKLQEEYIVLYVYYGWVGSIFSSSCRASGFLNLLESGFRSFEIFSSQKFFILGPDFFLKPYKFDLNRKFSTAYLGQVKQKFPRVKITLLWVGLCVRVGLTKTSPGRAKFRVGF